MQAKIFTAYRNQFCQECGQKTPTLIEVMPELVSKKIRMCMKCYKANFKKDLELL